MLAAFAQRNKKTDVAERSFAFHDIGLLVNEPSGSRQIALYLVFRNRRQLLELREISNQPGLSPHH
jgi:hypothetical protein